MKRRIAVLLCLLMLVSVMMTSCSSGKGETVMSYGDVSINENIFIYMLALGKTQLLQNYSGATTDIPMLWAQTIAEGTTFDDLSYLDQQLDMRVKLFFADYALQHGGKLTSEEKKELQKQMDALVEQFGTKAALNKYLETYTMNYDLLEDYYEIEFLHSKGLSMAFSIDGEYEIPVEDAYTYYDNNFVTVKHIAIGTEYAGTDEDGNYIYYTEEEKAERKALIDGIITALENGEDWDKFAALSEDKFNELNPDGYTITRGVLDRSMAGYESVAFSLEEGEWDTFELEGTSTYIIKRVPLLESDFENCYSTIMTTLIDAASTQTALDHDTGFVINEDIIDAYNMAMIPVLS